MLSCRERGQGTSVYIKLQEIFFLSETSERTMKWNAWYVTQGFGWFCGSRKSMLSTIPVAAVVPAALTPPQLTKHSCSTHGDFQSYPDDNISICWQLSANLHFLKDLQLVSQWNSWLISQVQDYQSKALGKGLSRLSASSVVQSTGIYKLLAMHLHPPITPMPGFVLFFNGGSTIVCYL